MTTIRDATPDDMGWVIPFLEKFSAPIVIAGARFHDIRELPAFVAERAGDRIGVLTYRIEKDALEGLVMRSAVPKQGIGRAMMLAMIDKARTLGKRRIYFTTTEDNLPAQALHASVGCKMVHREIGGFSKVLKMMGHDPQTARMIGQNGQPIRDILHYEKILF